MQRQFWRTKNSTGCMIGYARAKSVQSPESKDCERYRISYAATRDRPYVPLR